ncbi:hypothetical protein [Novosphingobium sp. FKTRR1]|uniref:hypothetical protein n=1 Tax=Novosphingobium sp. FKTRR1 TaxID=2879118 RepID=UPI001CF0B3F5|nr:hypothetical protein [Novosphingobium sp. FKTRR1]
MSASAMRPGRFRHFAAIDWSGAAGERHAGIAVALCRAGDAAPELVRPAHRWSRAEVRDWLAHDLPDATLVGMDLGISLPFADEGAFFPGWGDSPTDAPALWALIEQICQHEPHFGVSAFVDHDQLSAYFRRHGGREGAAFGGGRGRMRVAELAQQRMGCQPTSNFNLVGAAQVGKSSLSGMRVLHELRGHLPVWPVDPLPAHGSVACEIYTTIAAMAGGRSAGRSKIRQGAELDAALAALGSGPARHEGPIDDHRTDAILTAAWLRTVAHDPALWEPDGLTPAIARTEGWTFGAR